MVDVISQIRGGIIVSCQAEEDDPFNRPEYLALFARAAEMGGARGIRAREAENIRAICAAVSLPVIGITKGEFPDGSVLITGDFHDVEAVLDAGAAIAAADATGRIRPNGLTGARFIAEIKKRWDVPLMADISTLEEGLAAEAAGADLIGTTLAGYTPYSESTGDEPDWELLRGLVQQAKAPVILEGRIWTPEQAKQAMELGAYAVVVGTAITRPRVVTRRFVDMACKYSI
jgi:N-acylglucosamine-6-phosphate 2-epimerase